MSISTYGELKTAVGSYLNRSDLTSYIPDFIRLGERRISYGSDAPNPSVPLRIPAMQNQSTGTITNSSISFPTGFLEVIRLKAVSGTNYWTLDYAPPNRFTEVENSSGLPTVYTFINNSIQTAGTGSASYVLDYYKSFTALASDADTNWLLANAPDTYLFAALLESAPFISDLEMINVWAGMYKSTISSLNRSTMKPAGGSMLVRPSGGLTP
jgi:hypothetical protein